MSSDGGRRPEAGGRDRFDAAIDLAVREMVDVEPPAGLRGRVMDRIDGSKESRRKAAWMAAPLAAAAVIVLAVLVPWRTERPALGPLAQVATDRRLPAAAPGTLPAPASVPQVVVARDRPRSPRAARTIEAAVDASEQFAGAQIEALAGPAPLAVERLSGPPAPAVQTLDVAPIEIPALEVNAITETPRERREE